MTDTSRVLVSLRVPASATRAFAAFTEQIAQWWQPNGLFEFTEGRIGTLAFEPGPNGRLIETYPDGESFVVGHILVWDPPHRLVLTWCHANFADDQETELHVRFDDVHPTDGATVARVTVEHFGWDAIPRDHAARHGFPLATFQLRFAEWWQTLLHNVAGTVSSLSGVATPNGSCGQSLPPSELEDGDRQHRQAEREHEPRLDE